MWKHNGIEINLTEDGYFCFRDCYSVLNRYDTLKKATSAVDEMVERDYKMTSKEFKEMLSKLTVKEQNIINAMHKELEHRLNSSYYKTGVSLDGYDIEGLTY